MSAIVIVIRLNERYYTKFPFETGFFRRNQPNLLQFVIISLPPFKSYISYSHFVQKIALRLL